MQDHDSAEHALTVAQYDYGTFSGQHANFICPHCGIHAQQSWGIPWVLGVRLRDFTVIERSVREQSFVFAACSACGNESIFHEDHLIHPKKAVAPSPHPELPEELSSDFEEARQISSVSPRGAAALLRLLIQKLCPLIGAAHDTIDKMIAQLVREGKIAPVVQQALDSVRVIGNEAVHPGTLDLSDDAHTVHSLFNLVNFVVEKTISEPRQIGEIFAGLPSKKLEGIERRDGRS